MSENKLYLIELENNKYFLHYSPPLHQHYLFRECIVMFDFVKNNPPINIIEEIVDIDNVLKIDYYVKYYMKLYGIQNVRGGNYTAETLPDHLIKTLTMEINTTIEDYENQLNIFEDILQTYQNISFDENEKMDLMNRLDIYKSIQELINFLQVESSNVIKNDLEWMESTMEYIYYNFQQLYKNHEEDDSGSIFIPLKTCNGTSPVTSSEGSISKFEIRDTECPISNLRGSKNIDKNVKINIITKDEKERYKSILKKINKYVEIYLSLTEDPQSIKLNKFHPHIQKYLDKKISHLQEKDAFHMVYLRHPNYILDFFFLHPQFMSSKEEFKDLANEFIKNITTIVYTIINIVDELMFDMTFYPPDFEKRTKYALEYYKLLCSSNL